MQKNDPLDADRRKHDLMAPLCNIRAFTEELRVVAESLDRVIEQHQGAVPEALLATLKRLADDDIRLCTNALDRASDSLELKISQLPSQATKEKQ